MGARSRQFDSSLALLRHCDPVATARLLDEGLEEALDAVAREITCRSRRVTHRPSHPRLKLAIVVAVLVALAGGVATAAVVLRAHTGLFPSKSEVPIGGPGEELNPAASDFRSAALAAASDIPYPAGYDSWREWVLTEQAPKTETAPGGAGFAAGLVTTGALRGWFAASAFCAWVDDWRQATITGDAQAVDRAAETIAAAPRWKAVTAEDPNPSPSAPNDPGAQPGTLFGWMLPYRDAVLAGDRGRVEQLLVSGYGDGRCWLADPDWMAQERRHSEWSKLSLPELGQRYKQFLAGERP